MDISRFIEISLGIAGIVAIIYKIASIKEQIYQEIDKNCDKLSHQIYELKARLSEANIEMRGKESLLEVKLQQLQNDCLRNDRALNARITDIEKCLETKGECTFTIRSRDRYNLDIDSPGSTDIQ